MFSICELRTFYPALHSCGTSGLREQNDVEIRRTAGYKGQWNYWSFLILPWNYSRCSYSILQGKSYSQWTTAFSIVTKTWYWKEEALHLQVKWRGQVVPDDWGTEFMCGRFVWVCIVAEKCQDAAEGKLPQSQWPTLCHSSSNWDHSALSFVMMQVCWSLDFYLLLLWQFTFLSVDLVPEAWTRGTDML